MPKNVKTQLQRSARKRGLKGAKKNSYIYGTIGKIVKRTKAKRRGK
jgi:hypothetical protein